mmetsp:Transcript_29385/g.28987  ORF Transcript_29385/g.28987 Transcript_29385/m.28987 type:complete len:167 (-) Transcript_29385:108-608(-)
MDQLNQVYDMRQNPALRLPPGDINLAFFSQGMARNQRNNRRANNRASPYGRVARSNLNQEEQPLRGNMNGYNLDLLDLEDEDDYVYDDNDQEDILETYTETLRIRELERLYHSLISREEQKEGVKKKAMKKLKKITIKRKQQYAKDDTCPICLSKYSIGSRIIKLP